MVLNLVFCHTNLTLSVNLLRIHVFCKASTELAKENTVLVSEIFIVYFFLCQMTVTQKWTMEFDKKFLVLTS